MVKISAQSEHFSVLILKVSHGKFWLLKPIFISTSGSRIRSQIPNTEPDPGSRPKLNVDPTGSGSETLQIRIAEQDFSYGFKVVLCSI